MQVTTRPRGQAERGNRNMGSETNRLTPAPVWVLICAAVFTSFSFSFFGPSFKSFLECPFRGHPIHAEPLTRVACVTGDELSIDILLRLPGCRATDSQRDTGPFLENHEILNFAGLDYSKAHNLQHVVERLNHDIYPPVPEAIEPSPMEQAV